MVIIFAKSLLLTISIISAGNLIWTKFFPYSFNKDTINKYLESGILGAIFISFISFIFNFFIPLDLKFNNILFLFPIIFFIFYKNNKKDLWKLIKLVLIISLISTLLLSYSNFYRPDAGWYHIPYTKLITDHKMIIGSVSLHWAFGTHSILQYLSAFMSNSLIGATGILYANSILPSIFFVFFIYNFFLEKKLILKIFLFLIIGVFFIEMNRYSEYGNDNLGHLYFFYLVYIFLIQLINKTKISNLENSNKFFLVALFGFFIKTTQIFSIFIPLYFFFKKKLFKKIKFFPFLSIIVLLLWLAKNIFVSGCLIYPVQFTCLEKLSWYSSKSNSLISAKESSQFTELLQKGYFHKDKSNLADKENYLKNFNWLKNYFEKGFYKNITKKFDLFLVFIFLTILLSLILSRNFKANLNNECKNNKLVFLLILNLVSLLIVILKIPDGRFFLGYLTYILFSIILYAFHLLRKSISKLMLIKSMNTMLIILSIIFTLKNFNRIIYKSESVTAEVSLQPKFTKDEVKNLKVQINNKKVLNFVIADSDNIYFSNKKYDCVYSASPCIANQKIFESIKIDEKYNYIILKVKN